MKSEQLRKSILQYAIQGKLVPQIDTEEPASELLKKIKAEKQELIKQGKIKKEKPLPPITDDEKPFEIPESWEWVRVGSTLNIARGGSPRPIQSFITEDADGVNWIKIGDTDKGSKYINSTSQKIRKDGVTKSRFVHKGDFLLSNSMSFGRPYILNIDGCIHDGWLVLSDFANIYNKNYLFYLLSSDFIYQQFAGIVSGAVVNNLNSEKASITVIPLPPLAEQQRIVTRIEELMAIVDEYEKKEIELSKLEKEFPEKLKKSILQYAIQGKLVPQLDTEEPASELLKKIKAEKQELIKQGKIKKQKDQPPITDGEKPFDIPESWEWVRLNEIFQHNTGKALNKANTAGKKRSYLTTSNVYWNRINLESVKEMYFDENEIDKYSVQEGDLLVCEGGDVGRSAIWNSNQNICIQNHLHKLRAYKEVNALFYLYLMYVYKNIDIIGGKGIGIQGLSSNALGRLPIMLPPLAEQQRIVDRIEELITLVDVLANGKKLSEKQTKKDKNNIIKFSTVQQSPHKVDVSSFDLVARTDGEIVQDDVDSAWQEVQNYYDNKNN